MNFIQRIIIEPFERCYEGFLTFLPNLLTFIALLIVGIVLGSILRLIFLKIFRAIHLDTAAERIGVFEMLVRRGIRSSLSAFVARFIGWIVILTFAVIALQALKILTVENLLDRFFLYLPSVFTAAVILVFGYIFSNFFGRAALIASVNAGIRRAGMVGRMVKLVVFIVSATMAMEQLGIGRDTVLIAFAIVFGGIVLALAIAFGFGGRDIARDYLQRNVDREREQDKDLGDHIDPL
ncbi:MAG: conserved rane protein of unknown function [Deltaproteobacteria bacterium]|nr:conserved rane protein of unknown function [Deltaproteobacteria bacterium]